MGLLALFCWLIPGASASAYSASDATTIVNAYQSAFYTVSGTNGYIRNAQSGGITYFWSQAEEIECVIDAYEWTSNSAYLGMITNLLNGFITVNGTAWVNYTMYNDDIMWAVMAFSRGGVDTGKTNYCNLAKANFDAAYSRAYDTNLGGGLYWSTADASKNACVNGPASIAASLLFQIYGDTNYWNKATNIYFWERAKLFSPSSGAIYDNIGTNGAISTWSSTYNQGTFIGAGDFIGQTNDARLTANFTMLDLTSGGILPEYGIGGNNSGFNAIFLRWLTRYMRDRNLQNVYEPWLQLNAAAAWSGRRAGDNLSWCQWPLPTPAGTNFYSWDCISSYEALLAATPPQNNAPALLPTDYTGYWPLDATSGTVAADASGNGDNGTVNGATWNASGRFNGCLTFNGSNNDVQITNPVSNDFSIVFWVRTTQAGGSPQWYNGAGLVDGDYPQVANDFGTALVGGKFAFGVGNPDTTVLSRTLVNDGTWHQCAATRQEATGVVTLYVDGALQTNAVTSNRGSLNSSAHLLFGAIASGGGWFNGALDEVKIYGHTLTSNEVAALYDNGLPSTTAPANLTATGLYGQVRLNWWESSAVNSYNVKRSLINGGPYVTLTNVTTASFTDTNVVNNRAYYYVVSSVNAVGESTNSLPASASPLAPAAWFRADAVTGLANGAPVSAWADASGNGWTAMQNLSANQPTFVTNAMNGLPVVRFNAANSSWLWFYPPVQNDFTIIVVFQSSQTTQGAGTTFAQGAGLVNGDQSGVQNDFGMQLNSQGEIVAGTGNPDTSIYSGAGFNNGRTHVATFRRTQATGALAVFVDGVQYLPGTGGTAALTAPPALFLGAVPSGGGFFTGDLAEVQIYNAALATSDRLGLESALKCKYGLSAVAPSAPASVTAAAGNRQISLNWTLTTGAIGYNLSWATNKGGPYQLLAASLAASSYVDTNAANGQTNYYEITSADDCGTSTTSAAAAVFLPLPVLGMNVSGRSLALNWPGWANDWVLYVATNLTPPTVWLPVTNAPGSNNSLFNVTLPLDAPARFFLLSAP